MNLDPWIRPFGRAAIDGPSHGLFHFAATELALVLAIVVISLLVCGASSRSAHLPSVLESTRLSALDADTRLFGRDKASGANNDDYLEGLAKALNNGP